jgi:hypothetical protein
MKNIFKKINKSFMLCIGLLALIVTGVTGCDNYTQSDKEYWFSSFETNTVEYDSQTNNRDEVGTYWNLVSKRDVDDITISLKITSTGFYETTYFYINDEQIKSDDPTGTVYSYIYSNISLKKGDKIKIHSFDAFANSQSYEYKMTLMTISQDGHNYLVVDNSKS